MAEANVDNKIHLDSLTVCPVCFQKFNIPRILPCSHTFCQACLDSHIKSSCDKTTPLGFTCPLCRDFILAPGVVGEYDSDKWSELIPVNKCIVSLLEKYNGLATCEVCKADGNEETATSWCKDCESTFCETCSTTHQKFKFLQKHDIISLTGAKNAAEVAEYTPKFCTHHPHCKIELFCRDHQMSSCALCVPLWHRTCKHIGSVDEEAIKSDITELKANGLLKEVKRVCEDLEKVIEMEKLNIRDIDEKVDLFSEMIKDSYDRCVKHLNEVKEMQLNQMAKMSRDNKFQLGALIQEYENRNEYLRKCQELIERALKCEDYSKILLWYSLIKEKVGEIQKLDFKILRIDMTSIPNEKKVSEIENFRGFINLNVQEHVRKISDVTDFHKSRLHAIKKWEIPGSDIRGGAFLSNGLLILTDFKLRRCALFSEDGNLQRELIFSTSLWGMYFDKKMEVFYVALPEKQEIKMINLHGFAEIKTFPVKFQARGITNTNGIFFAIGVKQLCTFNSDFELINETDVNDDSDDITSDASGNIIYSCYRKNTVTKKNKENKIIFVYRHQNLESPYGLAVDPVGNIYVCGRSSNNIHVISEDGKTLRILYGFDHPQFIAFQGNSFKFFVVEESDVNICELF